MTNAIKISHKKSNIQILEKIVIKKYFSVVRTIKPAFSLSKSRPRVWWYIYILHSSSNTGRQEPKSPSINTVDNESFLFRLSNGTNESTSSTKNEKKVKILLFDLEVDVVK